MKQALTIHEAADAVGVSDATIYRLIRAGQLTAVWVVGKRRITVSDLAAYLERQPRVGAA